LDALIDLREFDLDELELVITIVVNSTTVQWRVFRFSAI